MADIPLSPIHTSVPDRSEVPCHTSNAPVPTGNVPISPPRLSTIRRRLIVDEEESEEETEVTPNNIAVDGTLTQQAPLEANVHPADVMANEYDLNIPVNGQSLSKKHRVLTDITAPMPNHVCSEEPLPIPRPAIQGDSRSVTMTQEFRLDLDKDPQTCDPDRLTPSIQTQQDGQQDQQEIPTMRSSQQGSKRRVLQFHGPWQWQVQRQTEMRASSVITMTDVTSATSRNAHPRSPVLSPPGSTRPVSTPYTKFPRLIELTQSSTFYAAEPSSFLPLAVHEPRYLRPRRKVCVHQIRSRHPRP
jgi:hypothetical protein